MHDKKTSILFTIAFVLIFILFALALYQLLGGFQ